MTGHSSIAFRRPPEWPLWKSSRPSSRNPVDERIGLFATVDSSRFAPLRTARGFLGAWRRFVHSAGDKAEPSSGRSVLPPPLLACLDDFAHVPGWPNLENVAIRHRRMLRHELYRMIHVPRLKDENAAELFLGFRVGTVGGCHFAVLPVQGQGGFRRLKRFSTSPVPVGAKMVVVFKAYVEHGVLLALSHAIKFVFIVVSQTDVFHYSSPPGGNQQRNFARWLVHL